MVGYSEDWAVGLHFPSAGLYAGRTGWSGLFEHHTLAPGGEYIAEAWLQFEGTGNIAPVFESYINHIGEVDALGMVKGDVRHESGEIINHPVVIVEKNGKFLTWAMGSNGQYSLMLPEGVYNMYAVSKNCAPGVAVDVNVSAGGIVEQNFSDVRKGGKVFLNISDRFGNPVNARIKIVGMSSPIARFLGANTFFTGLNRDKGMAAFVLPPGRYVLEVSSGSGFVSKPSKLDINVETGSSIEANVIVEYIEDPAAKGWYSADLHHHSDKMDGRTPPEVLVKSQIASRLDLLLVSDHDDVDNHQIIKALSDSVGIPFIPAVEVSPNWANFIVINLPLAKNGIDPAGTPAEIFSQAREKGATVIVAHPYITCGYFYNKDKGVIPGSYDSSFDLIELQSTKVTEKGAEPDELTLKKIMELWTESINGKAKKYYLSAGSDNHDVWLHGSGAIRIYAYPDGKLNPSTFVDALTKGHAFVTMGPLIYPVNVMYGETYHVKQGSYFKFKLHLVAVDGLVGVEIYSADCVLYGEFKTAVSINFVDSPVSADVEFNLLPEDDTWYCVIATDSDGARAISNPIWINVDKTEGI